jgi:hypothetical protein
MNLPFSIKKSGYVLPNNPSFDILAMDNINKPNNGPDGSGLLYSKIGDDGIFWLPNSAGTEVDLTGTGGGLPTTGGTMTGDINMNNNNIINVSTTSGIGKLVDDNTNNIATNTTNISGTVTIHSDVSSAGSGAIISIPERIKVGFIGVTQPVNLDVMEADIATNIIDNTGTVTIHSDVTNAGSGAIITTAERNKVGFISVTQAVDLDTMESDIGTNTTNNTGTVTVHSDVTDAGSGAIITTAERNKLASLTSSDQYRIKNVNTSTYTVLDTEDLILVDYTTTGQCTITLPVISGLTDGKKQYNISDSGGNAFTNNILINRGGTDTIMDDTSILINNNNNNLTLISDGISNWLLI